MVYRFIGFDLRVNRSEEMLKWVIVTLTVVGRALVL